MLQPLWFIAFFMLTSVYNYIGIDDLPLALQYAVLLMKLILSRKMSFAMLMLKRCVVDDKNVYGLFNAF